MKAARLVHCLLSIVGLVAANNYQTNHDGDSSLVSIRLELLAHIFLPCGHYNGGSGGVLIYHAQKKLKYLELILRSTRLLLTVVNNGVL